MAKTTFYIKNKFFLKNFLRYNSFCKLFSDDIKIRNKTSDPAPETLTADLDFERNDEIVTDTVIFRYKEFDDFRIEITEGIENDQISPGKNKKVFNALMDKLHDCLSGCKDITKIVRTLGRSATDIKENELSVAIELYRSVFNAITSEPNRGLVLYLKKKVPDFNFYEFGITSEDEFYSPDNWKFARETADQIIKSKPKGFTINDFAKMTAHRSGLLTEFKKKGVELREYWDGRIINNDKFSTADILFVKDKVKSLKDLDLDTSDFEKYVSSINRLIEKKELLPVSLKVKEPAILGSIKTEGIWYKNKKLTNLGGSINTSYNTILEKINVFCKKFRINLFYRDYSNDYINNVPKERFLKSCNRLLWDHFANGLQELALKSNEKTNLLNKIISEVLFAAGYDNTSPNFAYASSKKCSTVIKRSVESCRIKNMWIDFDTQRINFDLHIDKLELSFAIRLKSTALGTEKNFKNDVIELYSRPNGNKDKNENMYFCTSAFKGDIANPDNLKNIKKPKRKLIKHN